jgi:hypothetical protein
MVVLRLTHIVAGAVWVGFVVFVAVMLMPAVQEAGPAGGQVMAALQKRGVTTIPPILALATVLSGLWMYWRYTGGFQSGVMTTTPGATYGIGGTLAIIGFAYGIAVLRPAVIKVGAVAQRLAGITDPNERSALSAELGALRARALASSRLVALLLVVATAMMAVARYL